MLNLLIRLFLRSLAASYLKRYLFEKGLNRLKNPTIKESKLIIKNRPVFNCKATKNKKVCSVTLRNRVRQSKNFQTNHTVFNKVLKSAQKTIYIYIYI